MNSEELLRRARVYGVWYRMVRYEMVQSGSEHHFGDVSRSVILKEISNAP